MDTPRDEAYVRSLDLLVRAATEHGFVASPAFDHYAEIWVRDAAISSLGALASGRDELVAPAVASLETMAGAIGELGQVPAVVRPEREMCDWGEGGVVDATAWYVILAQATRAATGDDRIAKSHWPSVSKAMSWLRHQDVTGTGLLSAAPSTDWMDASLVRSGRTLNLNVVYYWASSAAARLANAVGHAAPVDPTDLRWRVNTLFWPEEAAGPEQLMRGQVTPPGEFPHSALPAAHAAASNPDRSHYVSHVIHSDYNEHCDVLANIIAISTGLASEAKAARILEYLVTEEADKPYPTRVWIEPVDPNTASSMFVPGVERHLDARWHNAPFTYHNAGVWPFVGGLHAAAAALAGQTAGATSLLSDVASANAVGDWGFHEWLHGRTGKPGGARDQTWNAGTYILAYHALIEPDRVRELFTS